MVAESKVKLTHEWGRSRYSLNQSQILSWVLFTHKAEFYENPEIQIPSDKLQVQSSDLEYCRFGAFSLFIFFNNMETINIEK